MEYFVEDQRASDKEEGELTSNDEDEYNSLLKDIVARENVRMGQEHISSPDCFIKGESFVSGRMTCSRKRRKRHREHSQEHQNHKSLSESRYGTSSQLKYQQSSTSSCRSVLKHQKSVKMTSSPHWHKHRRRNSRGDNMEKLESPKWEQEFEDPSYYQNENRQTVRDSGSRSGHWSNDSNFTLSELQEFRNEGREFRKNKSFGRTNTGKTTWQEKDMHQTDETILQAESRISEYSYTERLIRFQDSLEKNHICTDVCQEIQSKDVKQVQKCQKFLKKIKELAEYKPKLALHKLMKFHKRWRGTGRHIVSDLIEELENVLHNSPANNTFHGRLKDLDEADQKPLWTCNNRGRYETEFAFVPNFGSEEPCPGEELSSVDRPHNDDPCYPNLSRQRFRQRASPRSRSLNEVNSTGNSPPAILLYNTMVNTPAQQQSPQFVFVPLIQPSSLGQETVTREEQQFGDTRKIEILNNGMIISKRSNSDLMDNENSSPFNQDYKFSDRNLTQQRGVFRELSYSHLKSPHQIQQHGSARRKQNEHISLSAWNESLQRPLNMHQEASEERLLNKHFREKIRPHNAFTRTDDSPSSEDNISKEKFHQVPVNERKFLFANRHKDNLVPATRTVSECENYETNNQFESSCLTSNISIQNIPHKFYSPHNTLNKGFVSNNFGNGHLDQMRSREVENGSLLAVTPCNVKRTLLPTPQNISKSNVLLPTPKNISRSNVWHKTRRFRKCSRKTVRNRSSSVAQTSGLSDQRSCILQVWPAVDDSCAEATPTYCPPAKKMKYSSPLHDNSVQIVPSIELTDMNKCVPRIELTFKMNNCDLKSIELTDNMNNCGLKSIELTDNMNNCDLKSIELTDNMNNCDLKGDTDSEDEASVLRRKLLEDREKRKRSTENHSVQLTEASSSVEQDNMNLQPADVTQAGEQLVVKQLFDDQNSSQIREEMEGICPPFSAFSNNFNNITPLQPLSESCTIKVESYESNECNGDEVKDHLGCLLKKNVSQSGIFEKCQTVQCLSKELPPSSVHMNLENAQICPLNDIKKEVFVDCTNTEQTIDHRNDENKSYTELLSLVNKCLSSYSDLPSLIERCRNCLQAVVGHDKQGSDQQNPFEFSQQQPLKFSVLDSMRTNPSSEV